MGPLSRFEKIEAERPPREAEGAPREPGRFLATEAKGALPAPAGPPTRLDAEEPGLRTADGELDRLPTLACAVCGEESSKFASHCRSCGGSLHTEEAQALNLRRLAERDAEAEAQRLREAERLMVPGPGQQPLVAPPPEPLAPSGPASWPRWAQVLAVAGVVGLLFPRLLVFSLPGLALWLAWYFFRRHFR